MEESARSGAGLEVSVSLGRFEKDELSWDKWSSFSPNNYLEEAGNLSTPGSVAQKKAYFEAHYKKIAARKAEELEQQKSMEPISPSPDISSMEDFVENSLEIDNKFGLSNGGRLIEEVAEAAPETLMTNGDIFCGEEDDSAESAKGDVQGTLISEPIEAIASEEKKADLVIAVNCETENAAIDGPKDELKGNGKEPQLDERKEALLVGSRNPQEDTQNAMKGRKNGIDQSIVSKRENSKLKLRNVAQKGNGTPYKKEVTSSGTKKKVVSPSVKPLPASTPRYPKPSSVPTPVSASKTMKKQVNESPLLKSKNYPMGESKRTAPTSMHMSLSLSSANSLAAISMTRKSLIMEKMGDKDIIKRAFKTFQNHANGSITDEKPIPKKLMSPIAFEPKISTFRTPAKVVERQRKDSEKRASQRSQSGTKLNSSAKGVATDRKNTVTSSPTTGMNRDEKAQKGKEFLKKLEAKSIARGADKSRLSAKPEQARVESEIHHQPTLNSSEDSVSSFAIEEKSHFRTAEPLEKSSTC